MTTGFWAAVMPVINDGDNQLAATGTQAITNPNLYFFSWLAFLMSFFIFFDFMKHKFLDKEEIHGEYFQVFSWAGLMATSFIVLANSSRLFNDSNCDDAEDGSLLEDKCKRTKLAVGIGTVSTIIALVWLLLMACLMETRFGKIIDLVLVLLNIVMWTCGIAYITFGGEKAPAQTMGNLYFFTWASFALSVLMTMSSLKIMMDKGNKAEDEAKEKEPEQKEPGHKGPESQHEMKGTGEEADTKDAGEETV
jgi:heme exporter protein D